MSERFRYHDESDCDLRLTLDGSCPRCRLVPDTQSVMLDEPCPWDNGGVPCLRPLDHEGAHLVITQAGVHVSTPRNRMDAAEVEARRGVFRDKQVEKHRPCNQELLAYHSSRPGEKVRCQLLYGHAGLHSAIPQNVIDVEPVGIGATPGPIGVGLVKDDATTADLWSLVRSQLSVCEYFRTSNATQLRMSVSFLAHLVRQLEESLK